MTVYSGNQLYFRELQGGGSRTTGTQNSNGLHFGVGDVEIVDSLVAVWSNGLRQVFRNVLTNREYRVKYGAETLEELYSYTLSVDDNNSMIRGTGRESAVTNVRYEAGTLSFDLIAPKRNQLHIEMANGLGEVLLRKRLTEVGRGHHELLLPEDLPNGFYLVRFISDETEQIVKVTVVE
ncbi:MAG: ASPIC/UnbV domain-containing protein [Chlorobi bacterium]|nr:ASPIC/UnbV domain-containing protein [Chlorobiota bacterium]